MVPWEVSRVVEGLWEFLGRFYATVSLYCNNTILKAVNWRSFKKKEFTGIASFCISGQFRKNKS